MKNTFYALLLLMASHLAFSQAPEAPKGNGKITGIVRDSTNTQPVEFANIALIDPKTNKPINGSVADEKGKFSIVKIPNGSYFVDISFIGYRTKRLPIKIAEKKGDIELGFVTLSPSDKVLNEVVVQGQKNLIEEKVDRTIYNAENDATTRGGDATDVLKRVPMLSVDLDGNVSMRGSQNILVLINNKPSTITASSVADALKQIPADQIKTVEVITSPSSKYDAEGTSGIINIITKKNTLQGLTLNVDASAGLRGSNLGLNGNYRTGKMGFSLGGFGRSNYNQPGSFTNNQSTYEFNDSLQTRGQLLSTNIQSANTRVANIFGQYTLGWDYDIDKKNSLAASLRYGLRNNYNWQDGLRTNRNGTDVSLSNVNTDDKSGTSDFSLTYTKTFDKPQRELSLLGLYSVNNRTNDFVDQQLNVVVPPSRVFRKNDNKSKNEEMTIQLDYQTPVGKGSILEMGAKQIIRRVNSDFVTRFADADGIYDPPTTDVNLSNALFYNQNVTGGYTSFTTQLAKTLSLKAGGRYEYTTIDAFKRNSEKLEIPDYGIFVPSINASKRFKNGSAVKLGYNRRIQRPSIQFLNPNIQGSNLLNITLGNPNLQPEFTNNYELSYNTFVKGSSISISSFTRNTFGSIQPVRDTIPGLPGGVQTSYQNIGNEDAYGASVFANVSAGKLSLNGGVDTYYAVLNNNVTDRRYNASNSGWVYNARLFGSYNLAKGWGLQFFTFYRGRQVQLQGTQGGFGVYSLSLRKDLPNKKGSIGFGAENFFYPSITIRNEQNSPLLSQNIVNEITNLNFKVTFSYRIGKMSMEAPRRRKKSINNDDMKDEGGGGDGGQGGGGAPAGAGGGGGRPQGGPPVTIPSTAKPAQSTPAKADTITYEAAGTWNYIIESPQGGVGTLKIKKEGSIYSGTIASNRSPRENPLKGVVFKNNELSFTYEVNFGGNTAVIAVKGIITNDQFAGTMSVGQFGSFPMNGTRKVEQ
ncbi:MAG: TonB-dependent receptor family protein [Flammeovirgaceae bacterium]|nr:TonB-dependent receptor family protein [Flammeovirgaceae bacterium]